MMDNIRANVRDVTDEEELRSYLNRILDRDAFDRQGLIYGMGHAIYTISDPRAEIFRTFVEKLAAEKHRERDFRMYQTIERIAPDLITAKKKNKNGVCANVDFYSGLVYDMLGIPRELYTPLFSIARIVGWSAHRMEELITSNKILRPAYVNVHPERSYVELEDRKSD
ncbi:MAG: hypothetical protein J5494_07145, partial [Candidatus Methanomethylophilaceae archaeon]|nr:hypothetical protein [Candidatus Methanomethylophilaceae archaeon]